MAFEAFVMALDYEELGRCLFADRQVTSSEIDAAIETLAPRLRFVIEARFSRPFRSLRVMAKDYPRKDGGVGVTPERVRQLEKNALWRIRGYLQRVE